MYDGRNTPGDRIAFNLLPPIVKDLADVLGEVAMLLEMLRQRHYVRRHFTEMGRQIPNAQCIGPSTGQERSTRRIANRLLAIRSIERHAAGGKLIQIGRFDQRMTVASPKSLRKSSAAMNRTFRR